MLEWLRSLSFGTAIFGALFICCSVYLFGGLAIHMVTYTPEGKKRFQKEKPRGVAYWQAMIESERKHTL
tara:strand:- start:1086 stop:1292 length:207 start_codon:yes stop_codon:yes gene_type:complete